MHRAASMILIGFASSAVLAVGLSQEWFVRRCSETGLPLAAVVMVVAVVAAGAGVLAARLETPRAPSARAQLTRCGGCGQSLMTKWRMCPYCGQIVDHETTGKKSAEERA